MVKLNRFTVSIDGADKETDDGYVIIEHGKQFSIRLSNNHYRDADADVYVDGKHIGCFRVRGGQTVSIERSVNDSGRLTAYRGGTQEAYESRINPSLYDSGLIKVSFRLGNENISDVYMLPTTRYTYNTMGRYYGIEKGFEWTSRCSRLMPGGVGLSGHSNQDFNTVPKLIYDEGETVINLRLVFRDVPRPLKALNTTDRILFYTNREPKPQYGWD